MFRKFWRSNIGEPRILNPWLLFAYSLYNFYEAVMTIIGLRLFTLGRVSSMLKDISSRKTEPSKGITSGNFFLKKNSEVKILNFNFIPEMHVLA